MSALDLLVVLGVVGAGVGGYRVGFMARALSWVGLAVGLFVGVRLLPVVVARMGAGEPQRTLLAAAVVLVTVSFVGQAIGLVAGSRVRGVLPHGRARAVDKAAGAAAGVLGVLIVVWMLLPPLAAAPGWPARETRRSILARAITVAAPAPPDTLGAIRALVGERGPEVFDKLRPAPDAGVPPADAGLEPDTEARVRRSVVKVMGQACTQIQEGSGFVVQDDVVVTNAHVVAGEERVHIVTSEGETLVAAVTVFDPDRDLAVLQIDGLGLPALGAGIGEVGSVGAVFGHPGGVSLAEVSPALIAQRVEARGRDLYGAKETLRDVYILASDLAPGDSGGPLVDAGGKVVGVAFAIAPDRPGTSYALTTAELDAALSTYRADEAAAADTGGCLA